MLRFNRSETPAIESGKQREFDQSTLASARGNCSTNFHSVALFVRWEFRSCKTLAPILFVAAADNLQRIKRCLFRLSPGVSVSILAVAISSKSSRAPASHSLAPKIGVVGRLWARDMSGSARTGQKSNDRAIISVMS